MKSLRSVIQSGFARAPFLLTAGAILTAGTLAVGITAASASIGSDDGTTDQGRGDQSGIPITPSTVIVVFAEGSAGDDGPSVVPIGIDEVLRWANTDRGGKQVTLVRMPTGCARWGICERPPKGVA